MNPKKIDDYYTLVNGATIPVLGFGTWRSTGAETFDAVSCALAAGYRLIDTASFYGNQNSVGEAIRACGLRRDEIFVTSKLWNDDHGYEKTLAAVEKSLEALGLDYLDFYLIHWPVPAALRDNWQRMNAESWRAMEELCRAGKIRSLGVSNFRPHHLRPLLECATIWPAVNQVELHPGMNQTETLDFCRANNIRVEAWAPLGRTKLFDEPVLVRLAENYHRSPAQICLRWAVEQGIVPIPKSVHSERIRQNAEIFDFELSPADMSTISSLPPLAQTGHDPDNLPF